MRRKPSRTARLLALQLCNRAPQPELQDFDLWLRNQTTRRPSFDKVACQIKSSVPTNEFVFEWCCVSPTTSFSVLMKRFERSFIGFVDKSSFMRNVQNITFIFPETIYPRTFITRRYLSGRATRDCARTHTDRPNYG